MPISFDAATRTFKLDTATSTYMIRVYDEGYLLNLYYGAKIPDSYVPDRNSLRLTRRSARRTPSLASMASRRIPRPWNTALSGRETCAFPR